MAESITTFATKEQMAERSGGAIPADTPFLEEELAAATEAIRTACGWHIAGIKQKRFVRVGPFSEQVWLPAMRIRSIDAATIDGTTVAPAGVEFDPDTGWTSLCGRHRLVTFTAGFESVPAKLVTLTLELAFGGLKSRGVVREQTLTSSVTWARATGALTDADAESLTAYKIGYVP